MEDIQLTNIICTKQVTQIEGKMLWPELPKWPNQTGNNRSIHNIV